MRGDKAAARCCLLLAKVFALGETQVYVILSDRSFVTRFLPPGSRRRGRGRGPTYVVMVGAVGLKLTGLERLLLY